MKKLLILSLIFAFGCRGEISISDSADRNGTSKDGTGSGSSSAVGTKAPGGVVVLEGEDVGPTKLTRIRQHEYINIVRFALGSNVEINLATLPSDHRVGQFASNSEQTATQGDLDLYWQSAEFIASQLDVAEFCEPELSDAECGESLVRSVGHDLFRKTVSDEVVAAHRTFIDALLAENLNRQEVFESVVSALLQNPSFIYRVERVADVESGDAQSIEGHAVADRLSAFFWRGEPDALLIEAAENGSLSDRDEIETHVRRMLADPRSDETVRRFHRDWLEVSRLDSIVIDDVKFPEFDGARESLAEEYDRFVVLASRDRGFRDLFAADYVLLDNALSAYYGTDRPTEAWDETEVGNRGGIMTTGAVLAVHGEDAYTQSLFRGLFVREQVLCHQLPGRPENVDQGLSEQEQTLPADPSDRERLDHLTNKNGCETCHQMMNPIGHGFGGYDAIGMWQDVDSAGHPLDLSVTLEGTSPGYETDIDGTYDDIIELSSAFAESADVRRCYAKQWFRFGTGRIETVEDSAVVNAMADTLEATDDIEELIVSLATSPAFLLRRAE